MKSISTSLFNKSVFINCPLDKKYLAILKAMIFTIKIPGLEPNLASAFNDCSEKRLDKIENLIKSCKYSIHDLSRMTAIKKGDFARMNMPFELGLDFGCKKYASSACLKDKKILVMDKEQYRIHRALSDFSGIDIFSHNEKEYDVIELIGNWLQDAIEEIEDFPGPSFVWGWYKTDFPAFLVIEARERDILLREIYSCSILQYKKLVSKFLLNFKPAIRYQYF